MAAHRTSRGQSLVEFALVFPVFMLLVFGVIDGGRAIFAYNQVSEAVRNVARVASVTCLQTVPHCDGSTPGTPISNAISAQQAGLQAPLTWSVTCVDPLSGATVNCVAGATVRVSASTQFNLITPIAQSFGPVHVGSTTQQQIIE